MGTCNSSPNADRALEAVDPPVASVAVIEEAEPAAEPKAEEDKPRPAPFTVDLHEPRVDASAPLDERDIDLVQQTFARVALLGAETVGWILFMNIFRIAPEAVGLFPFKDDPDISSSPMMRAHGAKIVNTVGTAVSLLRDLDTLVPVLHSLGLRHVGYGVIPAHYDIVGQALIQSLGTALGPNMTPAVTNAYLKVFTIVKNTMIEKCDYKSLAPPEEVAQAQQTESPAAAEVKEPEAATGSAAAPEEIVESEERETDPQVMQEEAKEKEKEKKETTAQKAERKKSTVKKKPEHSAKKKIDEEAVKKKKPEEKPEEKDAGVTLDEQLLAAALSGDDKVLSKVLKAGANVNAADSDGKTALHMAAEKGWEEICGRLTMNKQIKCSMKTTSQKETALHYACREGHKDCAAMICRAGVDLNAKNKAGKIASELAKDTQLSTWLRHTNPSGTTPPWQGKKMN